MDGDRCSRRDAPRNRGNVWSLTRCQLRRLASNELRRLVSNELRRLVSAELRRLVSARIRRLAEHVAVRRLAEHVAVRLLAKRAAAAGRAGTHTGARAIGPRNVEAGTSWRGNRRIGGGRRLCDGCTSTLALAGRPGDYHDSVSGPRESMNATKISTQTVQPRTWRIEGRVDSL